MLTITTFRLRRFNDILSIVVIAIAIYIFLWPFLPGLAWRLHHIGEQPSPSQLSVKAKQVAPKTIPAQNTLLLPRLDLSQPITEGPDISALRKGVWRRPQTSMPDKDGNTVIVGHRFTYDGPAVFYNLDKIRVGDPVIIYWQSKEYNYSVSVIKVVGSNEVSIESNTPKPQLTLYTCTPLWSAKDRLVIIALPVEAQKL